jgi:YHS domain-containing protein
MEGLIWLLAFAGFFYLMMRFGCGTHMVHGRHGGRSGHGRGTGGEGGKDPVCGMQVAADSGYTKMHAGTRYWFCSKPCLEKFDAEPARYATGTRKQEKPT